MMCTPRPASMSRTGDRILTLAQLPRESYDSLLLPCEQLVSTEAVNVFLESRHQLDVK